MTDLTVGYLLREHREIERWLEKLHAVLESEHVSLHERECLPPCPKCIAEGIASRIERLIQAEEEVLFPALADFLPGDVGPLAVLRGGYGRIQEHLRWLQVAADSLNPDSVQLSVQWKAFRAAGQETRQAICDQIYKKDRVLFPLVVRWLSPQQDESLRRQLELLDGQPQTARRLADTAPVPRESASPIGSFGS